MKKNLNAGAVKMIWVPQGFGKKAHSRGAGPIPRIKINDFNGDIACFHIGKPIFCVLTIY